MPVATTCDVAALLDEGRWTAMQKWFVLLVALTIIFDGIDNQLLGIAIPSIMRDWSMARAAFSPVLAGGMVGMMIGGATAGIVGDRFGRKTALLGSVFVFGLLTLAAAEVRTLTQLTVLRLFAGIGLGGALPNAAALVSEFVPRRHRAIAVTLAIVCVPFGGMLSAVLAEWLLDGWGWRGLFLAGGLLPAAAAIVFLAVLPESPRYLARRPARWPQLARFLNRLGHPVPVDAAFVDSGELNVRRAAVRELLVPEFQGDTLAVWLAFCSCLLAVYTAFNWLPTMLTGAGLAVISSRGILAFNLGGAIGAITGGIVIGRAGSRVTMIVMAAGACAGALVLATIPLSSRSPLTELMVMLTITGGLINAVQTTLYALAAQIYPTSIRATGVGAAVAVGRSGGIASTYAGAWALASGGSARFFQLIAVAMFVVCVALAAIRRHIGVGRR